VVGCVPRPNFRGRRGQLGNGIRAADLYIVLRYTDLVRRRIATTDYRALAALRYQIRLFLRGGDAAALRAGLEPQQFLLLLALRGLPETAEATIQTLAERLALKHNSTVELIDRLEKRKFVRRNRSREDRRSVLVSLLPRGEEVLARIVRERLTELRAGGAALVDAIDSLLKPELKSRTRNKSAQRNQKKRRRKQS